MRLTLALEKFCESYFQSSEKVLQVEVTADCMFPVTKG